MTRWSEAIWRWPSLLAFSMVFTEVRQPFTRAGPFGSGRKIPRYHVHHFNFICITSKRASMAVMDLT